MFLSIKDELININLIERIERIDEFHAISLVFTSGNIKDYDFKNKQNLDKFLSYLIRTTNSIEYADVENFIKQKTNKAKGKRK